MPDLDPILDAAPCGFVTIDDAGIVQAANTTLANLLGAERSEIEGQHVDTLFSAPGRIFYSTHLFPLLRLHGRAEELYVPLRHRDGSDLPVLVNGVTRGEGESRVHDLVVVPMRQRNQLENQLIAARNEAQEAAAAKDRFLSIVSHELRTPLAGVSGYAELLLRERPGPLTEKQRSYVERISDAARYQVRLIEDILDFAGLVGERHSLEPTVVPVEEVLARAVSMLAVRAGEEDRRIERHPIPAPGSVRADVRAVQQILLNLGANAIKYSPPDHDIRITAEEADSRVRLSVIDRGAGIAPDQIERIFEPFVQIDRHVGQTNARRGVGLGLSISRDLARAMGGDIDVQSVPGQGSTFTLELPAA